MNDWDIVETYHTEGVSKYIHANGMETTLKTVPTCGTEKNKAVLFISASVGCKQKCKFCYLTAKKYPYAKITQDVLLNACKEVIDVSDIQDKYLKISFMGMGEIMSEGHLNIFEISRDLFEYAFLEGQMCAGIDGVDVGTSAPATYYEAQIERIHVLNHYLRALHIAGVPFNEANDYSDRSFVRLFFSFHSINNKGRFYLMPYTRSMRDLNNMVRKVERNISIIFHHMLLEGENDTIMDVVGLRDCLLWYGEDVELRLLRFNKCPGIELNESPKVQEFIDFFLKEEKIRFKYQISAGSEISAACGQFLCKEIK